MCEGRLGSHHKVIYLKCEILLECTVGVAHKIGTIKVRKQRQMVYTSNVLTLEVSSKGTTPSVQAIITFEVQKEYSQSPIRSGTLSKLLPVSKPLKRR